MIDLPPGPEPEGAEVTARRRRHRRFARPKHAPDPSEKWSEAIVEIVTGQPVEHIDDGAVNGEVDALIHLGDGGKAALEITRAGDKKQFELMGTLARDNWKWVADSKLTWHLGVANMSDYRRLRRTLAHLIRVCDQHHVHAPAELLFTVLAADRELWWIAYESGSELFGLTSSAPGVVYLTPASRGGVVPDNWAGLVDAVTSLLTTQNGARHVLKLQRRTGVQERHLFLAVSPDSVPFGIYFELQEPRSTPRQPITLPDGITDLWLATGTTAVTRYRFGQGWSVHSLPFSIVRARPQSVPALPKI